MFITDEVKRRKHTMETLKMEGLELEQWIHRNIMKACWCEMEFNSVKNMDVCKKCGVGVAYMWGGSRGTVNNYKYTTSLDSISKVEEIVISYTGRRALLEQLFKAVFDSMSNKDGSPSENSVKEAMVYANPLQRARACKLAWEAKFGIKI